MPIDAASAMLRAAGHLDVASNAAARAVERDVPLLFGRRGATAAIRSEFATALDQARRAVRELEPLGAPLEDARAGIAAAAERIDASVHRRLVEKRRYFDTSDASGLLRIERDRLALRAELANVAPDVARRRLQAEVDAILDLPDAQVTNEQVHRLAVLTGIPAPHGPRSVAPVRHWHSLSTNAVRGLDGGERLVGAELHHLRLDLVRAAIEADPAATRAATDAELRAILARPHAELAQADLDRISVLARLRSDLRPAIMDAPDPWPAPNQPLEELAIWRYGHRPSDGQVKARLDSLRMAVEHERMLTDPSVTREAVTGEIVDILSTPTTQADAAAMQRLGTLLRLPEHLRPQLPRPIDSHLRIENLGLLGATPSRHLGAARVYDSARLELLADADPAVLVRELRARVGAGQDIDLRAVTALARHDPALLADAGVSERLLRERALEALTGSANASREDTAAQLAFVRTSLTNLPLADDVQRGLRDEALELIDANVDRIHGRRADTYSRHPDYAEVGRIASTSRLLHELAGLPQAPSPSAAPREVLTW